MRRETLCVRLAAALLLLCIGRLADLEDLALAAEDVLAAFALVEGLAGDDAVDFWRLSAECSSCCIAAGGSRKSGKWRCSRGRNIMLCCDHVVHALSAVGMWGPYQSAGSIPVRMFWKASSTLLASKADVSMKDRLFSPAQGLVSTCALCSSGKSRSRIGTTYLQTD